MDNRSSVRAPTILLLPVGARPDGRSSIAVKLGLERSVFGNTDIFRLFIGQLGDFGAYAVEVKPGYFFIEEFRQDIDFGLVLIAILPKFDLREHLVRKRV